MNHTPYFLIFILSDAFLVILAVFWFGVLRPTHKLFVSLRELRTRAEEAETLDEVNASWDDLVLISKKCWHRNQGAETHIIAAILKTKHKILLNNSSKD